MGYGASLICLKFLDDLECRREDANETIVAAEENTLGSRAHAADIIALLALASDGSPGIAELTSKSDGWSASSGGFTWPTSKKLKIFHWSR